MNYYIITGTTRGVGEALAPSFVAEIIDKVLQLNEFPHGKLVRVNDYE